MESSFFLQWSARYLLHRKMTFGFPASATHERVGSGDETNADAAEMRHMHTGKAVCM